MGRRVKVINYKQLLTRNIANYDVNDITSCRLWIGRKTADGKYGAITIGRKLFRAHIICYEIFVGAIEEGNSIRQSCKNPLCVNLHHLVQGPDTRDRYITRTSDTKGKKVANILTHNKPHRVNRTSKISS
jgi:hypothetical protein